MTIDKKKLLASRPLDNEKHENFAQYIAAGATARDAFRKAELANNIKLASVDVTASKLRRRADVAARIQYLESVEVPQTYTKNSGSAIDEIFGLSKKDIADKALRIYEDAVTDDEKKLALDALQFIYKIMSDEQKLWKELGLLEAMKKRGFAAEQNSDEMFALEERKTTSELEKYVSLITNSNKAREVVAAGDYDADD